MNENLQKINYWKSDFDIMAELNLRREKQSAVVITMDLYCTCLGAQNTYTEATIYSQW